MREAVNTRAAAAEVGFGHLDQPQAGDRSQYFPRRRLDALRVRQVAGLLIGDRLLDPPGWRRPITRREIFRDVLYSVRELARTIGPGRIVREQVAVVLERRAAAGGVDDHRLDLQPLEGRDVAAHQRAAVV